MNRKGVGVMMAVKLSLFLAQSGTSLIQLLGGPASTGLPASLEDWDAQSNERKSCP